MPHYKLTYFPVRGLAEPIRLCFHYAGEKFEDYRVPKDAYGALKPLTPYGQLPILEVDGHQLVQSGAILRYVARKFNLIGKNEWETAKADEIWSFFYDSMRAHIRYTHFKGGKPDFPEDTEDSLYSTNFLPIAQKSLSVYSKFLREANSGFALPGGLSYADFVIAEHVQTIENLDPNLAATHPDLLDYKRRIHALPQLHNYLASRPHSVG
ncbi:unnamed protein product [Bursaphelenchus okinawaensis]|uniref:glutathione transferase n=1 Tax=Bursaphelenchus okinawaensis TaxID=465554 RepID=A0A811KCM2_9BILA|nr:unnamed protein product [Bursaphelenchus okinawaensis]CAG9099218.1 unnamed protein product [Bursaphelenchus okinawaensis]